MTLENIIVIRHAHAGKRDRWFADDYLRPLSHKGNLQSNKFAKKLKDIAPLLIYSSPRLRCIETVGVLSLNSSQPIVESSLLDEGGSIKKALKFCLDKDVKTVVMCTHGDLMYQLSQHIKEKKFDKVSKLEVPKAGYWWLKVENKKIKKAKLYKI